ncbi:MAG: cupin domain-containing protein [Solirubrobacteraceae bacterium]
MTDMAGRFDELPAKEVYAGVVRRTFTSDKATVTRYSFDPGATFPLHRHPQQQITLIEVGEVEMTVADHAAPMSAGDWSVIEADVEHGIRGGPGGAQVLAIVIPARASAEAYTVVG